MAFRAIFIALAVIYLVSGVDDLFLDLTYYVRVLFRALFRRRRIRPVTREQLESVPEKSAVIIVPAWDEANVISRMLLNTVNTVLYKNGSSGICVGRRESCHFCPSSMRPQWRRIFKAK
jgi:adsorption protein B